MREEGGREERMERRGGAVAAQDVCCLKLCSCVHASMHMHLRTCTCAHASVRMHLCTCTYANAPMRTHLGTCTYTHAPVRMHLCTCTCETGVGGEAEGEECIIRLRPALTRTHSLPRARAAPAAPGPSFASRR